MHDSAERIRCPMCGTAADIAEFFCRGCGEQIAQPVPETEADRPPSVSPRLVGVVLVGAPAAFMVMLLGTWRERGAVVPGVATVMLALLLAYVVALGVGMILTGRTPRQHRWTTDDGAESS